MCIEKKLEEAKEILIKLVSSRMFEYETLVPSMLAENAGVYAIYNKFTKETLYVGKTTKLRQRLYNQHLMGNPYTNARLMKYIIDDKINFPDINDKDLAKKWIKGTCSFQYIQIKDFKKRGHAEGLISFLLDVRYVDKEH